MLHNFVHHHGTDVVVVTPGRTASRIVGGRSEPRGRFRRDVRRRIDVVINGRDPRPSDRAPPSPALIGELGLGDRRVAVERNREVVPRAQHATTVLAAGDRLELVTFVGGG